jgi:DNA-binding CsgD family transcriptional regulator
MGGSLQASKSNLPKSPSPGEGGRVITWPPVLGFLVTDASLKPVLANNEAISILSYPGPSSESLADLFQKKVRLAILNTPAPPVNGNGFPSATRLRFGRRTYFCRAFPLNSNGKGYKGDATLFVLERGISGPLALSQISQQFNLTHREQQAVALLLQGLSNKEIAKSMGISANTVKAFLRMATLRMGVSTRSGIVVKILGMLLSSGNQELAHQR